MQPRMSMITLGVADMRRSVRFYQCGLGFPIHGKDDEDVAFFRLNGTWLGLFGRDNLAEDANVSAESSGFQSFAIAHNVTSEEEVDRVMQQALYAGASLAKKAQKTPWGGYGGYFKDPDGHLWEIAHNPFTWIGPPDDEEDNAP